MASNYVELRVNRDLLDPHFDGYKLSLDSCAIHSSDLTTGVDIAELTEAQYSYQHVKAHGKHNHLNLDPWQKDTVYWVDDTWAVLKLRATQTASLGQPEIVFQVPRANNQRCQPGRCNVTLHFTSKQWVVLADGAGQLYVISRNLGDEEEWKVCFSEKVLGDKKYFTVLHSSVDLAGGMLRIDCLLQHIEESKEAEQMKGSPFITVLEWISLTSVDKKNWIVDQTRRLTSGSVCDYAAVDASTQCVFIASERPYQLIYDSLKPVEIVSKDTNGSENPPPAYTWMQTESDVTVQFTVPPDVSATDIEWRLTTDRVELHLRNAEEKLLCGELSGRVHVEDSTWTLEGQKLEVFLSKCESGMWPLVVAGDTRGQMVMDPEMAAKIHEQLAHLTSETMNPDPEEGKKPAYNAQQLEECDAFPEDTAVLQCISGDTHKATHQATLGSHQWLFNTQLEADKLPAVCLRHDVDGLVWQVEPVTTDNTNPWHHVSTFNALGYVQASKQNRKFASCAPDSSYTVIFDCVRHAYIYRQPSAISSPLRNRKSGRQVSEIAKQQVVSLDTVDNILGMCATNNNLFTLAGRMLYVARINVD